MLGVLWLLLWVTWSPPEVVLVRSRHAIHRGVKETRRLQRHTHLPSTKPLLYGGRTGLKFAQQPNSEVGDVVLRRSTTASYTSSLFLRSEVALLSDYFKMRRRIWAGGIWFKARVKNLEIVWSIIKFRIMKVSVQAKSRAETPFHWKKILKRKNPGVIFVFWVQNLLKIRLQILQTTLKMEKNMLISPLPPLRIGACRLGNSPIRINGGGQWAVEQLCFHWPVGRT